LIRREAVASSRIEGTIANVGQLLMFESSAGSNEATSDVREVANYVAALDYGLSRPTDRPLSLSSIREMHAILMRDARGQTITRGAFRTRQNFIGRPGDTLANALFVLPPPTAVTELLEDLLRYVAEPDDFSLLIRLAVAHYQFEVIHPFDDGNGRLGRLLLPLLLQDWGVLEQPLLHLSPFFERHRGDYLDGLLRVSQHGDWHGWITFFLTAIETQANEGFTVSKRLRQLWDTYRSMLQSVGGSVNVIHVVDGLFAHPVVTAAAIVARLGVSDPTARTIIARLEAEGIVSEVTGQKRNRLYLATEIVRILDQPDI